MHGKKVLYAASTGGHLASFHIPYIKSLIDKGWIVHGAGSGCPEELEFLAKWIDLPFKKNMTSLGNFALAIRLSRELRREKYDLISVHTSLAAFFVRLAVMLAGKGQTRVVNTVHGYLFDQDTPTLKRLLLLGAEKLTAGVTDRVVVMNRRDLEIAQGQGLSAGDVVLVPGMGVDMTGMGEPSDEQRRQARVDLGLGDDSFVMVFAAEFSKRKGQEMLISAMELLPKETVLLLPGRGALLEPCKKKAAELGLEGRVIMPGFVKDVWRYYRAADICVSSSRSEGLPFNIMEAMAWGLPPVITNVKGHEDLVDHGVNGILFPWNHREAFVRGVRRLMDADELSKMRSASLKRAGDYALERVLPITYEAIFGGGE